MDQSLSIIFEDQHLLVVNKPAGVVTAPSDTTKVPSLVEIIADKYQIDLERAGIVHRLDKDTSGLLLVARDQASLEALQAQFKERTVSKEYTALAHGHILEAITVDQPIMRNPSEREKFITHPDGREAQTEFIPLDQFTLTPEQLTEMFPDYPKIQMRKLSSNNYGQFTLLQCRPKTGRTHQIRVHLKHLGHPIVGDAKYGGRKTARQDHRWCARQFLHASQISFNHPVTEERLTFSAPLPTDLMTSLQYLLSRS
jgi:23S rRNA pseudouridine1911/1915/1917 synthase